MKKLICVMVMLLAFTCACAEVDITEMEAPLAGVLACRMNGDEYPSDEVDNGYALDYLFYMANIFYADEGEDVSDGESYDRRVYLEADEVSLWLKWAFGDRITADDLEADDEKFSRDEDGGFWAGLADGYALSVVCQADEGLEGVPFSYVLDASDGTVREGALLADFAETGDDDAPLTLVGFQMDDDVSGYMGNWVSEDGYWFSLMEEGLVFLFDGESNLQEQGTFTLEDGELKLSLIGGDASGLITGGQVTLKIGDTDRVFCCQ